MKNTKKALSLILSFALIISVFSVFSITAFAEETSGTCGENLVWSLDENGTLTISGSGEMTNYNKYWTEYGVEGSAPWFNMTVKNVIIEEGVSSIGEYAFYECKSLESVSISKSVSDIGSYAFCECEALESITIPEGVTSLPEYLFFYCTSLKNVIIPDTVKSIGKSSFSSCSALESIEIPDSVEAISESAFNCCEALKKITIPKSVDTIPYRCFYQCTSLETVILSDSTKIISTEAFFYCPSLKEISFPEGIITIGYEAFNGCSSLENISLPSSVLYVDSKSFAGTKFVRTQSNWENGLLYLGDFLLDVKSNTEKCVIKDGTKRIASSAFSYCTSLKEVQIPDSVVSFGANAFESCKSLESITIPESITEIPYGAFMNCTSLSEITLHDSIEFIWDKSLDGTKYKSIESNWENGILYLGKYLIEAEENLSEAIIREGTLGIASSAFENTAPIAYDGSNVLSKVSLPESVVFIGADAFRGAYLTSIFIPESVQKMGDTPFFNCEILSEIEVDENNPVYHSEGGCLIETATKTLIVGSRSSVIPDDGSVETVADYAFYGLSFYKGITIPPSVKTIGRKAFGYRTFICDCGDSHPKFDNFKIKGVFGSAAEEYAKENEFIFEAIALSPAPNSWVYMDKTAKTMPNIPEKATVEEVISALEDHGFASSVTDKSGNAIEGVLSTGLIVSVSEEEKYTVVISGDVDGTGTIDSTDYLLIKKTFLKEITLENEYFAAADTDGSLDISSADYLQIKSHFLGIFNLFEAV